MLRQIPHDKSWGFLFFIKNLLPFRRKCYADVYYYDDSTKLEISDPDLELGFLYDGYIVTGTEKVIMEDSVTDIVPNGLRIEKEIKEPCKYYHAYTKEEIDAKREEKLSEISNDCNSAIVAGTEVELSNKEKKHFAYSIEDQSNVSEMFNAVIMG